MKFRKITFLFVALIFVGNTFAQTAHELEIQQLQVDVVYLSSDLLEGRETGKKGEKMAAQYIATRFKDLGLKPGGENDSYYHFFDFKYKPNPHSDEGIENRTGRNVLGLIDNGAKSTIVIGAHYDHLGHGIFGSLHTGEPAIHNGADDNASGVAAILRLAEKLKSGASKNNNYLIMGFSGEELGLYGSKFFVKNPTVKLESINYMINLDMVGRLNDENVLVVSGIGTSPALKTAVENVKTDLSLSKDESGMGPSDHASFYLEDIPVINFFTGQHSDYHKPADDSELINYEGMMTITDYILDLLKEVDDDGKVVFTKTKDGKKEKKGAAFKVTLGVMPDYTYQGEGMRIDGVMDERPAKNAGMEKGDIIIKMGDVDVKDIYDYMEGLAKYKKGEMGRVAFKRGDKIMVKNVTF